MELFSAIEKVVKGDSWTFVQDKMLSNRSHLVGKRFS